MLPWSIVEYYMKDTQIYWSWISKLNSCIIIMYSLELVGTFYAKRDILFPNIIDIYLCKICLQILIKYYKISLCLLKSICNGLYDAILTYAWHIVPYVMFVWSIKDASSSRWLMNMMQVILHDRWIKKHGKSIWNGKISSCLSRL